MSIVTTVELPPGTGLVRALLLAAAELPVHQGRAGRAAVHQRAGEDLQPAHQRGAGAGQGGGQPAGAAGQQRGGAEGHARDPQVPGRLLHQPHRDTRANWWGRGLACFCKLWHALVGSMCCI